MMGCLLAISSLCPGTRRETGGYATERANATDWLRGDQYTRIISVLLFLIRGLLVH